MDKNPRIIELYGLPGCGKTTVSDSLHTKPTIAVIKQLMDCYHQDNIFVRVYSLPLITWSRLTLFFLFSGLQRRNEKDILKTYYYLALVYRYFYVQHRYSWLIVDHGIIQQFGSTLHNYDFNAPEIIIDRFIKIIKSLQGITYVYCELSENTSLLRMRGRNRSNGRIDEVMNDTKVATDLLKKEKMLFDSINEKLRERGHKIDMTDDRDTIVDAFNKRFIPNQYN